MTFNDYLQLYLQKINDFLKNYGGYVSIVLYIVLAIFVFLLNPYGLVKKYRSISIVVAMCIGFIIITTSNFAWQREQFFSTSTDTSASKLDESSPTLAHWLLVSGGALSVLLFSGIIIYGIFYMISNFSRFLALFYKFSLAISIIAGLGIFYKFASPYLSKYKEGKLPPLLEFIKNFIFYVPCLLINVIENIAGTKRSTWILLLIQIIAIAAYFGIPALLQSNYFKKGTILINKPQHLNNVASIDQETLDTIMENTKRSLHYALSADVWIDPQPTSTRLAYTKDTNLLSFGNRLHIEYNGTTPRNLIIKALDGEKTIVVAKPIIPLQKWNKIILNYDHGTLDIFLNKELIHSQQNVPYTTLASIQAGSIRGIYGGIKDVRFFYEPLTKNEINLL